MEFMNHEHDFILKNNISANYVENQQKKLKPNKGEILWEKLSELTLELRTVAWP